MTSRSSRRVPVAGPTTPHHAHAHAHGGHGSPSTDAHAKQHNSASHPHPQHHPQAHPHPQHHHSVGPPASYQYPTQLHGMDNGMAKREDGEQLGFSRHVRASSDPISRGGAFDLDGGHRLDQEPNPFEQSFSGPEPSGSIIARTGYGSQTPSFAGHVSRRARSISPNSLANRQTPGGSNKIAQFSMIPSPGTDLSQFGWPQHSFTPGMMGGTAFDPSMIRTGLTPLGGASSSGGGVSFPPPSPATAALFAMMTNNTPGTAEAAAAAGLAGGGPRPHEGPNEANNFEASFARAASGKYEGGSVPAPDYSSHHRQPQMGPNGRAAHGVIHPSHLQNQVHPPQAPFYPQQTPYGQPQSTFNNGYSQNAHHPPGPLHLGSAGFPPSNHVEALYNLGQTDSHNDDALVAAAALSGLATPGFHSHTTPLERIAQEKAAALKQADATTVGVVASGSVGTCTSTTSVSNPAHTDSPAPSTNGGSQATTGATAPRKGKRGSAGGVAAANKRKKADAEETKPKVTTAKKGKRAPAAKAVSLDGMDDDDDDMDQLDEEEGQSNASPAPSANPNETEEEKRKNFLERNRQGEFTIFLPVPLKCRQRKKAWLANLQYKVESLTTDNDTLQTTVTNLKEEIQSLRAILQAHANCPVANGADRRGSSVQNLAPNGQQRY
ncbi:BQ2448_4681 [Microbotryum intermedium]|uniref:BQ2448_4681 protein n=1 Tax=Microbotryum intermedium TaxID=269621 RepID=A0A238FFH8_9BASI|nr:BQ2448_4681 [Microbotryum intermedium]